MQKTLPPAERLVVCADYRPVYPQGRDWTKAQVIGLAKGLRDTGVCIKVGPILRDFGYGVLDEIHELGLKVFADLKLCDTSEILATDGAFLKRYKPDFLSVMCESGSTALKALKAELPETEILGVMTLASLEDADAQVVYTRSVDESVMALAQFAANADIDGLIVSPVQLKLLRRKFGTRFSLNVSGMRVKGSPVWREVRTTTPGEMIRAGADRLIVGRAITGAESPLAAVEKILAEIAAVK